MLPGGRNSGQKAQKGPQKKKFVAEFWLILPKTGRKGAAENFLNKFILFLAVGRTFKMYWPEIFLGPGNTELAPHTGTDTPAAVPARRPDLFNAGRAGTARRAGSYWSPFPLLRL